MNTQNRKFVLNTFGCQMNQADAQRMRGILLPMGYVETENEEEAARICSNWRGYSEELYAQIMNALLQ